MAYQPKSYRKFLATSVTAAMVATVAAPVIPSVSANTSFSDVASNHWAADAIDYLVSKGAIEGYPNGTFQPNASITRAEAAKILAITLGLNVDGSANTNFSDASGHWASSYIAALQTQAPGVIDGYTDGTFRPNRTITRQEMAKMIVTAYDLQENEAAEVDFTDNTGWGAEYITTLASLGIVEGVRAGQFQPNGNVTRAQTPVFVHRAEVPEVRIPVNGEQPVEFAITNVEALTEEGRFAEVTFSVPASGNISRTDVNVSNARTGDRVGVQSVELSTDRRTLMVTFFEDENNDILQRGETYRFAVTHQGETYTYNYERPQYAEVRVIDVDHEDGSFSIENSGDRYTTSENALEVGDSDIDLEYVLGRDIRVWFNSEEEVVRYEVKDETVHYDAVEISSDEIELLDLDDDFDFADDVTIRINGEIVSSNYTGYFNYAKVVLDSRGDVLYINAYDWSDYVIVDEIDGTEIFGADGYLDIDLEDYVIVKDGETISIDDIEVGDAVFFNDDPENDDEGYAEVYTRTVTGEIENIFSEQFEVDGKLYDFEEDNNLQVRYLDEDGEVEIFEVADANDILERFQDAGEVTLYLDREGNLVFITGDLGELQLNRLGSILLEDVIGYQQATRDRLEVSVVKENGESAVYDFRLDQLDEVIVNTAAGKVREDGEDVRLVNLDANGDITTATTGTGITVNGGLAVGNDLLVNFATSGSIGNLVKVHLDDDGNVEDLEFYLPNLNNTESFQSLNAVGSVANKIDIEDDNFVLGKRLRGNTVVFDANDHFKYDEDTNLLITPADDSIDSDDVEVMTWNEYKDETTAETISQAVVYYDEDSNVTYLVIQDSDAEDVTANTPALIRQALYNNDGELVRVDVYIDNERRTFEVDELTNTKIGVGQNLRRGDAVYLGLNDNNVITEMDYIAKTDEQVITNVSEVVGRTLRGTDAAGNTTARFDLVQDGYVLDNTGSNVTVRNLSYLRNLDSDKQVRVILDYAEGGQDRFAKFFVIENVAGTGPVTPPVTTASIDVPSVVQPGSDVEVTLPTGNTSTYIVRVTNLDNNETRNFGFTNSGTITSTQLLAAPLNASSGDPLQFELLLGTEVLETEVVTFDNVAPTITEAVVTNADDDKVAVTFSEPVTLTDETGFSVEVDGASNAITGVTGDGTNTLVFSLTDPVAFGETVTLSYDATTGDVADLAGNALASVANRAVTNQVADQTSVVIDPATFANTAAGPVTLTVTELIDADGTNVIPALNAADFSYELTDGNSDVTVTNPADDADLVIADPSEALATGVYTLTITQNVDGKTWEFDVTVTN